MTVEELTKLFENHDCHLSPADGCVVCDMYWDMKHDLKFSYSTSDALSDYRNEEVRSMSR